ncbi:MAG: cytochrome-c peroxidase, partial [Gammaproteobacteria bacterium]
MKQFVQQSRLLRLSSLSRVLAAICLVSPGMALAHGSITAQVLKGVTVPAVPGLLNGKSAIVVDQTSAIQLGKALFWDANVGSDGVACASCHFHAGADRRTRNQLGSGILHMTDTISARTFEFGRPDYELKAGDFPLFRFADPSDKESEMLFSTDDVVSSAGVFLRQYDNVNENGDGNDQCSPGNDDIFHVGALNTRQATKRNAPTVINAAFNFRNFWDGRANNLFNGESAFGKRDPNAKVWIAKGKKAKPKKMLLTNASLASQAVAPPLDMMEMSCQGRTFHELGRKLLDRRPLEFQQVHSEDSMLASVRDPSGYGLNTTYGDLVKKAFAKKFWAGTGDFGASASGVPYSHIEANFAFFFGLAIQLYENTLVSDQTPFDEAPGDDGFPAGYTAQEKRGLTVFQDAHCNNCHSGPTFSAAINPVVYAPGQKLKYYPLVDRTVLTEQGDNFGVDRTLVDTGFADTSVVPNDYDVGLGGTDPFGNPLSFTRQYLATLAEPKMKMVDPFKIAACELDDPFVTDFLSGELTTDKQGKKACKGGHKPLAKVPSAAVVRAELGKPDQGRLSMAVKGAFKIPTLRNIELTGPYMHNGSMKSLEEVVEFYNRGGNGTNR